LVLLKIVNIFFLFWTFLSLNNFQILLFEISTIFKFDFLFEQFSNLKIFQL
jgi:hypothetical protein